MKVKDELVWAQQESELKSADEASRKFLDFLILWVNTAEEIRLANQDLTAREALANGFDLAEQSLGYLSVEWLSQMLMVLIQHWFSGDELWESLSVWERRMVEQATALKLIELQETAGGDTPEN